MIKAENRSTRKITFNTRSFSCFPTIYNTSPRGALAITKKIYGDNIQIYLYSSSQLGPKITGTKNFVEYVKMANGIMPNHTKRLKVMETKS